LLEIRAPETAVIVQEEHRRRAVYYGFGLGMAGLDFNAPGNAEHRYTYNGKEEVPDFGLGWLDYGARQYQPDIRWGGVEPLAGEEGQEGLTSYHFVSGNPVGANDPNGTCPECDNLVGIGVAMLDNFSLGLVNLRGSYTPSNAAAYNRGQDQGDLLSMVYGTVEAGSGMMIAEGAVVVTVGSGGSTAAVSVPAAVAGIGMVAHGTATAAVGQQNFLNRKGRAQEPSPQTGGQVNAKSSTSGNNSSAKTGKQQHKDYKKGVADRKTKVKEYTLPSGKKIDYIDKVRKFISELKPNNPSAKKKGENQLKEYQRELKRTTGDHYDTHLDTYNK
jgi:RHS repeat-associated protein